MSVKTVLEEYKGYVTLFTASCAAVGVVWGSVAWVDSRYAKTQKVEQLERRVNLNELNDQLRNAREELFFWRQQSRKYPEDEEILQSLKDAEQQVEKIKKEIEQVERKNN